MTHRLIERFREQIIDESKDFENLDLEDDKLLEILD